MIVWRRESKSQGGNGCLVRGVTLPPDQSARSVASWKFCIQRASRFGTTIRPVTTYSNRIVRNRPFLPLLPAWLSTRSRPWVESPHPPSLPCSPLIPFHQHQMRHFSTTSISVSLPAVHHRYLRLQSGLPEPRTVSVWISLSGERRG